MVVRPTLIRFLLARGALPEDARDLIQELYLKLDRVPLATVTEPRAYLYRMADNLLLDRRRSALRRSRREDEWTGLNSGIDRERDEYPAADRVLIARERLTVLTGALDAPVLTGALDALPERSSEAFRRFRIEGESQRDIAAAFGISVSAVEKHLQRAYRVVLGVKAQLDAEDDASCRLNETGGIVDD
jgi:RNA polymerase sigma factor (sigma-70 family)